MLRRNAQELLPNKQEKEKLVKAVPTKSYVKTRSQMRAYQSSETK
jgi:hypothetical protein